MHQVSDALLWDEVCTRIWLVLVEYYSDGHSDVGDGAAESTVKALPAQRLIKFGTVTATRNAVLRLEVEEVELLSGAWQTQGFQIPVCGEAPIVACILHDQFCFLDCFV